MLPKRLKVSQKVGEVVWSDANLQRVASHGPCFDAN